MKVRAPVLRGRLAAALLPLSILWTGMIVIVAAEQFELVLQRSEASSDCQTGELSVNGSKVCETLELPQRDNRRNISGIPAGTYSGHLRYDHKDQWRMELDGVPGRSNIQIHIGNFPKDSKGCILVGTKADAQTCTLEGSASAYRSLRAAFYGTENPNSTPNKTILLKIRD